MKIFTSILAVFVILSCTTTQRRDPASQLLVTGLGVRESMDLERLKSEAFALCQKKFEKPVVVPVPELDPPADGGPESVGMVFQEELSVSTRNFLDQHGFYLNPRPRAAVNNFPMDVYVDHDGNGEYDLKTWDDAEVNYSADNIRPSIDKNALPTAGRVLTEIILGHKSPKGDYPQLFDFRSSAYVRFAGYPPQITGASLRLGAHGLFGTGAGPIALRREQIQLEQPASDGQNMRRGRVAPNAVTGSSATQGSPRVRPTMLPHTEHFPVIRAVFTKIVDQKTANALVLLEGELLCTAMSIDMNEGRSADMVVDSYWYTREDFNYKKDPHTAFVAYSSMLWKTEKDTPDNPSDEAHDSDVLTVVFKDGKQKRITLGIPEEVGKVRARDLTNSSKNEPIEWILANEDRDPAHYAVFAPALGTTNYNFRASYKVTVLESSVKTGVSLYEQNTDGEFADNIVAASTIRENIKKAQSPADFVRFKYKTTAFFADPPDDCDPIRKAIANLPPEGGTVNIREGFHSCAAAIVIDRSNVALVGAGQGKTVIRLKNHIHRPMLVIGHSETVKDTNGNLITGKRVENITVSDLTLDGNLANHSANKECGEGSCDGDAESIRNNGITIRGASKVLIENVTAHDMISGGMVTEKFCDSLTVRNFESYGNHFDGFAGYETENSVFEKLKLHDNRGAGISIDLNFNNNTVRDSVIRDNGDVGIFARDLRGNKFVDLKIIKSGSFGIFLAASPHPNSCARDNTFERVEIYGSQRAGIRVNDGCPGNRVIGISNLCTNSGGPFTEFEPGSLIVDKGVKILCKKK
jgi:hypothetical protein